MIAQRTIEQKDALLEMQKPKVRFAEAVTGSDGSILIGELAKLITQNGYEIGRTRLFDWLRRNGYLFKNSTEPNQKWVEKGLFSPLLQKNAKKWGERVDNPNKLINFAAENIGVLIFLQECRLRLYP